jgi:hypothetical protein
VREERALEDGAIELLVELPAAELAAWAAQPGVQLLEAQPRPASPAHALPAPHLEPVAVLQAASVEY